MIFHYYDVLTNQRFNWRQRIGITLSVILLAWVSFVQAAPIPLTGVSQLWKGVQSHHSCVLTGWGEVKCWGSNNFGQLGDDTTIDRWIPVTSLISDVTAIATGAEHTCVLTSSGEVKCWGNNMKGRLGDGTITERHIPVDVTGLTAVTVTAIATGAEHTCALIDSGGVKCWGNNMMGQLGDGTTIERHAPVDVTGLTSVTVTAIATGGTDTCALTSSGGVKCWGQSAGSFTPVDVIGLTGVVDIAASASHICVLTSSGGVKCWGDNSFGELGVDNSTVYYSTPVDVTGLASGVTAIVLGNSSTCALTDSGGVKCWGYNSSGQLGDGTTTNRYTPMDVIGLTNGVTAIAAGYIYACALMTSDGGVKCWGLGNSGQLGDNTLTEHHTPVDVLEFIDTPPTVYDVSLSPTGDYPNWSVGETLVANYTYDDVDGDAESGTLFQWYQATDSSCSTGKIAITGATMQTYTLTSSDMGKYICFGVIPKNAYGTGTEVLTTSDITIIKGNQTISFAPPASETYGSTATLSATATSGLPVTFASTTTGICTVSGTTVSYISAGICTLTANQAGNANYNAAPQVTSNVVVNGPIVMFDPIQVTTLAGSGTAGSADGLGTAAQFHFPIGVALDTAGNLYVADTLNNSIRKIVLATGEVTTVAGDGTHGYADDTGPTALFDWPHGVAVDTAGNLYVADWADHRIRKIVLATGKVTTLANLDWLPFCVALDTAGNLYTAGRGDHRIRKIVLATGEVSTIAGSGTTGYLDATGTAAKFNDPNGVAVDIAGNLYVADTLNNSVRKIVLATGEVTTVAGSNPGYADGIGPAAKFNDPNSVAVDMAGNLYVTDRNNHRIRKVDITTGVVTTLAGSGDPEILDYTDGTGTAAKFAVPSGVTVDTAGNLYVADSYNNRIRKITPPVFTAFSTSAGTASAAQSFSVSGNLLTANLTVTAPTGYEVSLSAGSGYATSVNLTQVAGSVASTPVYIRLSATTGGGTYNGNITLDSAGATQQTLAVTGTITGPGYSSTPAPGPITVGTVTVGSSMSKTLAISETGTAQLDITNLALSGADAMEFSVSPTTAFSIADGGAAQTVTLICTPMTVGSKTATLTVTHNAVGSPATYTLTCTGTTLPTYSVTLATAGMGTVTGENSYVAGDSVTLTATAATGSTFAGWSGDALCTGTSNPLTFTMPANAVACTATFDAAPVVVTPPVVVQPQPTIPKTMDLQVYLSGDGEGTVTSTNGDIHCDNAGGQCTHTYDTGTYVTLTATPAAGSTFWAFGGNDDCEDGTVSLNSPRYCTAYFHKIAETPAPVVTPTEPVIVAPEPVTPVVVEPTVVTPPVVEPTPIVTAPENVVTPSPQPSTAETVTVTPAVVEPVVSPPVTAAPTTPEPVVTPPPVVAPVTAVPVVEETNCPPKVKLEADCDAQFQTIGDLEVTDKGYLTNAIIEGTLKNSGWVSNLHVKSNAVVAGGTVTGRVENEGLLCDFIFRGSSIVGGTLCGEIRNISKVGGLIQDVQLAKGTTITGGLLSGEITGDCDKPAKLENVRILRGSHLSCVVLGDGVVVEDGVTIEGTEEIPELPALGKAKATDAKGKSIEVKSELTAGITALGGKDYQTQATVKVAVDPVDVTGQVVVDPKHVGQVADLFVYAIYQGTADSEAIYLMRDGNGGIFLWNQNFADLVPFQAEVKLTDKQTVTLYKGVFLGKGLLKLYFGYRLQDGTVVQNGEPLQVTVE